MVKLVVSVALQPPVIGVARGGQPPVIGVARGGPVGLNLINNRPGEGISHVEEITTQSDLAAKVVIKQLEGFSEIVAFFLR